MSGDSRQISLRWFRRIRFWAFALVGLVVGHNAVFLAEFGADSSRALAATGHDYWYRFAILALLVAAVPIAGGFVALARLRARIARYRAGTHARRPRRVDRSDGPSYLDELLWFVPRLFAAIGAGFVVQENLEHLATEHEFPGLAVLLWPHHPLAIPVLFGIALLLGASAAWLRWRRSVLERRLSSARTWAARVAGSGASHASPAWSSVAASVAHRWLIARRLAGRAPPRGIAA